MLRPHSQSPRSIAANATHSSAWCFTDTTIARHGMDGQLEVSGWLTTSRFLRSDIRRVLHRDWRGASDCAYNGWRTACRSQAGSRRFLFGCSGPYADDGQLRIHCPHLSAVTRRHLGVRTTKWGRRCVASSAEPTRPRPCASPPAISVWRRCRLRYDFVTESRRAPNLCTLSGSQGSCPQSGGRSCNASARGSGSLDPQALAVHGTGTCSLMR